MSGPDDEAKKPRREGGDLALDTDLGWAIRLVGAAFRGVATDSVADLPGGARGYLVLVALASGEPPSQLAPAKEVSLDRTVMTYLLDDLEAHELITRRPDPRDRRARQALLTDTGRTRLQQVRRSLAAAEARLLTDLGDQDAEQLREPPPPGWGLADAYRCDQQQRHQAVQGFRKVLSNVDHAWCCCGGPPESSNRAATPQPRTQRVARRG
ncbi:MarR family winged helix-turn-helix transcriptional regulator [Streptomyces asiaticus]